MYYKHYSEISKHVWLWPNFKPEEIACRGDGSILIDPLAMNMLQQLRRSLRRPVIITCGYRSEEHNGKVGGAKNSFHLLGRAFDIKAFTEEERKEVASAAKQIGFHGIGHYKTFIHIDNRKTPREWHGYSYQLS